MIYSTVNHQKFPFSEPTHLFDDVVLEWSLMQLELLLKFKIQWHKQLHIIQIQLIYLIT